MSKSHGDQRSQRPWMKYVKQLSDRKNRRATKQIIHHEKSDDLSKHLPAKVEDSWCWD